MRVLSLGCSCCGDKPQLHPSTPELPFCSIFALCAVFSFLDCALFSYLWAVYSFHLGHANNVWSHQLCWSLDLSMLPCSTDQSIPCSMVSLDHVSKWIDCLLSSPPRGHCLVCLADSLIACKLCICLYAARRCVMNLTPLKK